MISHTLERAIKEYEKNAKTVLEYPENVPVLHTDEVASQVASFYEKTRNVIDFKEDHLIRRGFINRVLRRRLLLKQDGDGVGEMLVKEIIRAGHLPNDKIPETVANEIQNIIDKHIVLSRYIPSQDKKKYKKRLDWLFSITASSIEERLFPPLRERLIADIMFRTMKERIVIRGAELRNEDISELLFSAVLRTTLKVDEDHLNYLLLKFLYPDWDAMTLEECPRIGGYIPAIRRKIKSILHHPLTKHFSKTCGRYAIVFNVIADVIIRAGGFKEFTEIAENPASLEEKVKETYVARFVAAKKKLKRIGFFSVISFFLSKILIVLLIEIPVEMKLTGSFSVFHTALNVVVPPALMFFIMLSIKMPRPVNFNLVFEEVQSAIFPRHEGHGYIMDVPKKKWAAEIVSHIFYFALFFGVFYLFSRLLIPLDFNIANVAVLVFFISLVAAAGVRIHHRANEMSLEKKKTNVLTFLFDLFIMPFVAVGRVIIDGLARFNPIVIFINLLIELPFQVFVQFVENFHGFIRQKKEDVV